MVKLNLIWFHSQNWKKYNSVATGSSQDKLAKKSHSYEKQIFKELNLILKLPQKLK